MFSGRKQEVLHIYARILCGSGGSDHWLYDSEVIEPIQACEQSSTLLLN